MASVAAHLTLLVPGLFGPRPSVEEDAQGEALRYLCEGLPLAALERLLSRAVPVACPWLGGGMEEIVARALGYEVATGVPFPFASITHRCESGGETGGWCLRADPVHLKADLHSLRLSEPGTLGIEWAEAVQLLAELSTHFSGEPWRLEAWHPERWYLCGTEGEPGFTSVPPSLAAPLPLTPDTVQGPRARYWRSILNEAQMLMHASPVNERRVSRGATAINSMWLWGGGRNPPKAAGPWRSVLADDELVRMLTEYSGLVVRSVPPSLGQIGLDEGSHLMVLGELYRPQLMRDVEAWRDAMSSLCSRVFIPLARLLACGHLAEVTIAPGSARSFHLTRRRSRRWWVRAAPLPTFMAGAG